jgi:putative DNA primase/helicase
MHTIGDTGSNCNDQSLLDRQIAWTMFTSRAAHTKSDQSHSLRELAKFIREQDSPVKDALPWLKLARFGVNRTSKGSLRNNRNVLTIDGIEADYDAEMISLEQARDLLRAADIAALIYTSPSHSDAKPRWRVLCPLSETQRPDKRNALLARLNGVLGGVLAGESFTLSQAYFYGSVGKNPAHRAIEVDGRYIDLATDLDAGAIYAEKKKASETKAGTSNVPPCTNVSEYALKVLEEAKALFAEPQGDRHQRVLVATAMLARFVKGGHIDRKTVIDGISEACEASGRKPNDDEVESALDGAVEQAVAPENLFSAVLRPTELMLPDGTIYSGRADMDDGGPILTAIPPGALPGDVARSFLNLRYRQKHQRTLQRHAGSFYSWTGSYYRQETAEDIRARLYEFLEVYAPGWATSREVSKVADALTAKTNLPAYLPVPTWTDSRDNLDPTKVVVFSNGLLDLTTRQILSHTPAFFGMNALPFPFDPEAPEPVEWLRFLASLWPDDQEPIDTLQEWFGANLVGETRFQKILLLVGPRRSGKGTVAKVLREMLGAINCCGPTLASLADRFGLQSLIGKLAAIVGDARLSDRADKGVLTERLLSLSGEDAISVQRKNLVDWEGRLTALLTILTNELPRLSDASGALAGRFLILSMMISFYGREDTGLFDRLRPEMPGILLWSLKGLDRLLARGRFVEPKSSGELKTTLEDITSQVAAFVRSECVEGGDIRITKRRLYDAWCRYCQERGWKWASSDAEFGRKLRAAIPTLNETRPVLADGKRSELYVGVNLSEDQEYIDVFRWCDDEPPRGVGSQR